MFATKVDSLLALVAAVHASRASAGCFDDSLKCKALHEQVPSSLRETCEASFHTLSSFNATLCCPVYALLASCAVSSCRASDFQTPNCSKMGGTNCEAALSEWAPGACPANVRTAGSCEDYCTSLGGSCARAEDDWEDRSADAWDGSGCQTVPEGEASCALTRGTMICACRGISEQQFWQSVQSHCGCHSRCSCMYSETMKHLAAGTKAVDLFVQLVTSSGSFYDVVCSAEGKDCLADSLDCTNIMDSTSTLKMVAGSLGSASCPSATLPERCPGPSTTKTTSGSPGPGPSTTSTTSDSPGAASSTTTTAAAALQDADGGISNAFLVSLVLGLPFMSA
eukprot:TRINITY_DN27189_c0_g1_i1.p1 TRINITY_DN27189_c0_g1~~TRINITY_DN27189_c0_g1_i1.p1  ORF type:complete len:351 (+),score=51.99 TRINITY_DN27189_c0_g1_i1:42-1055(+)